MRKRTVIYIFLLTINISFCQYRNYAGQPFSLSDLLIWENDTIQIQTFPLMCWTEFDQKVLFDNKEINPDCWGCLKNHTAEWKIINNKLYLSNIYSYNYIKDSIKTDLNKLFPDKTKNNLVLADWYSGILFVPKGEHIWMGQSPGFPIYESEWEMIISNGHIIKKEFKSGNYNKSIYTQDTKYFAAFLDEHLDEKTKNELKRKRISIIFKTGKSKNDFSISIKGVNDKIVEDKLIETLKTLPEFDYYYRHGEELIRIITIAYIDNRPIIATKK
ncbi:hypothetical protein [Algibacter sp. 2305UL17-15]|uniref:hypothetical protein n=1 Tax=Algibacter sp. 2305UL17-15 TaxID=3231268 RepID=UPI003459C754